MDNVDSNFLKLINLIESDDMDLHLVSLVKDVVQLSITSVVG